MVALCINIDYIVSFQLGPARVLFIVLYHVVGEESIRWTDGKFVSYPHIDLACPYTKPEMKYSCLLLERHPF